MKKTILLSVMSAALLAMGTASAGGGSLFGSSGESSMMSGLYVGGSYGQATTNCMISDALYQDKDCTSDGWKAFAGYQINDLIAVEGAYYHLGEAEDSVSGISYADGTGFVANSGVATGEASGFAVSGVAGYEIFESLDIFGKLGAISYTSEGTIAAQGVDFSGAPKAKDITVDKDGVALLWGIGGSYQITENIGVRGEYEGFTREDIHGQDRDVGIMSAGMTFSTY